MDGNDIETNHENEYKTTGHEITRVDLPISNLWRRDWEKALLRKITAPISIETERRSWRRILQPVQYTSVKFEAKLIFEIGIDRESLGNNLDLIRQDYVLNYNVRAFEISQPHISIIKDIRIDPTLLKPQLETVEQLIVDCMSRDVLQKTKIVIFGARKFTNSSRDEEVKDPWLIRIRNGPFCIPSRPVSGVWLLSLASITSDISCLDDFQILVRRLEFLLQRMFRINFPSRSSRSNFLFVLVNRLIRHSDPPLSLKARLTYKPRPTWVNKRLEVVVPMMSFDLSKINTKDFVYERAFQVNPRLMTGISYINIPYESRYHLESSRPTSRMNARRKASVAQALSSQGFGSNYSRAERLAQQLAIVMEGFIGSPVQMEREIDELTWRHNLTQDRTEEEEERRLSGQKKKYGIYNGAQPWEIALFPSTVLINPSRSVQSSLLSESN